MMMSGKKIRAMLIKVSQTLSSKLMPKKLFLRIHELDVKKSLDHCFGTCIREIFD